MDNFNARYADIAGVEISAVTTNALPGWEHREGIWNGPFPYDGFNNSIRMCANCGGHIAECMGCVKIGDILPTMQGKPLTRFPRELCFNCATLRCHWDEEGNLVKTKPKFKEGDRVNTEYNGATETLVVRHVITHPEEYEDYMPVLYEMNNGQVLKEFYLRDAK